VVLFFLSLIMISFDDKDKKQILTEVVDTAIKKFFDDKFFKSNDKNKCIEFRDGRLFVKFLVHEYEYIKSNTGFLSTANIFTRGDELSKTTNHYFTIPVNRYFDISKIFTLNYTNFSNKAQTQIISRKDKNFKILNDLFQNSLVLTESGIKKASRKTLMNIDKDGELIIEDSNILNLIPNGYILKYEFPENIDEFFKIFFKDFIKYVKEEYPKKLESTLKELTIEDEKKTDKSVNKFLKVYDKDGNNTLDLIESNGFSDLLKNHQKQIIEVDKSYIQHFVKLSFFLKSKSEELERTFQLITQSKSSAAFKDRMEIFDLQYQAFTTILMHSYNMILSVIKGELIDFYEIYEVFDQLHIFESKYEKTMLSKLDDLIESNISLEKNIIEGFSNIELSIDRMNASLTNELKGINDKLWWNNAFQMVQIYQNRKINKLLSK